MLQDLLRTDERHCVAAVTLANSCLQWVCNAIGNRTKPGDRSNVANTPGAVGMKSSEDDSASISKVELVFQPVPPRMCGL